MADDADFVPGITQDNAVLLLAAAEELGLDQSVVQVDHDRGGFRAPEDVVAKATDKPKASSRGKKKSDEQSDEKE